MNCRTFRRQHVAFVDDTVSGVELLQLREHVASCEKCAALDAKVRRALLLARNLPPVEPSRDFGDRLRARLRFATFERELVHSRALSRYAAAAAILVTLALGLTRFFGASDDGPLVHAPVVATVPEPVAERVALPMLSAPAILASLSTGLPLWPAALVADEVPAYFVNATYER